MQKIYFTYFSFINFDEIPQKHIKLADQGSQRRDMSLNYPQHKCNFPGKFENSKAHKYA